ncbi:MAG: hypothetical protein HY731_09240 [Candidatus Tectomicrobia bacterium]|nr:hypothetical protein [Candidatus Tectomicrobia bacterium]
MNVQGHYTLKVPQEQAWYFLTAPAFIATCIPGSETLDLAGEETDQILPSSPTRGEEKKPTLVRGSGWGSRSHELEADSR